MLWAGIKNSNDDDDDKSQTIWGLENYTAIIASLLRFRQKTREDEHVRRLVGQDYTEGAVVACFIPMSLHWHPANAKHFFFQLTTVLAV